MVTLKEQLMQERNDARREKARLDHETVSRLSFPCNQRSVFFQTTTSNQHREQEKVNGLLKK